MTGYRLTAVRNVAVASASAYGSGTYGDADVPYGQRATDPADQAAYVTVPGGTIPIRIRTGESVLTLTMQVVAFGGPFEDGEGTILDLSTVATARLHLQRLTPSPTLVYEFDLTIDAPGDKLSYTFADGDLTEPGQYRPLVVATFASGRRLTLPVHNAPTITVTES